MSSESYGTHTVWLEGKEKGGYNFQGYGQLDLWSVSVLCVFGEEPLFYALSSPGVTENTHTQ